MATALMAWLRAPAPTTWTSTSPDWRTTPAMAPATELGLLLLDTFKISTAGPQLAWPRISVRARRGSTPASRFLPPGPVVHLRPPEQRPDAHRGRPAATRRHRYVVSRCSLSQRDGLVVAEPLPERDLDVGSVPDADLLAHPLGDLDHQLEVLGQEVLGVLPTLDQLLALARVPSALLFAHVD